MEVGIFDANNPNRDKMAAGFVAPVNKATKKQKIKDIFLRAGMKRPHEYKKAEVFWINGKPHPWGLDY